MNQPLSSMDGRKPLDEKAELMWQTTSMRVKRGKSENRPLQGTVTKVIIIILLCAGAICLLVLAGKVFPFRRRIVAQCTACRLRVETIKFCRVSSERHYQTNSLTLLVEKLEPAHWHSYEVTSSTAYDIFGNQNGTSVLRKARILLVDPEEEAKALTNCLDTAEILKVVKHLQEDQSADAFINRVAAEQEPCDVLKQLAR
jgi:hypothetical protein